jgi:hypothetical protein
MEEPARGGDRPGRALQPKGGSQERQRERGSVCGAATAAGGTGRPGAEGERSRGTRALPAAGQLTPKPPRSRRIPCIAVVPASHGSPRSRAIDVDSGRKAVRCPIRKERLCFRYRVFMASIQRPGQASKDPAAVAEAVRVQRLREDAQRPMSVNLAETIALSHALLKMAAPAQRQ